jgi:hypothetical protein
MSPRAAQPPPAPSLPPDPEQLSQPLATGPLMFIENGGQFADGARFLVHGGDRTVWLAQDALWVTVLEPGGEGAEGQGGGRAGGHAPARLHTAAPPPSTPSPIRTVAGVWVGYGGGQNITLTARISNTGVVAASNVPLAFRLDDAETGTIVAQTTVGNVGAGVQAQVQAVRNAAAAATGWHRVYAVVDPSDAIVEADETNNVGWAGAGVLPDLALDSTAVVTGINADGSQAVSLWVFNRGQRSANGVLVGLYNRLPISGTAPLASAALSIPAGEHRVANLNLGGYQSGFYAGVDVNQQVEDRDLSNNVLRVGEVPRFVYLPLILRNR